MCVTHDLTGAPYYLLHWRSACASSQNRYYASCGETYGFSWRRGFLLVIAYGKHGGAAIPFSKPTCRIDERLLELSS